MKACRETAIKLRMKTKKVPSNDVDRIYKIIEKLEESLPPIFTRSAVPRLLGGAIAAGTLANLGKDGPPYVRSGHHVIYEKGEFLEWFRVWLAR